MSTGKVIQVIGPVVDVEFPPGHLPNIYNALKVNQEENKAAGKPSMQLTLEVAQHLGENRVRGVAMSSTDGLTRGMNVEDTGAAISVPVGRETLGRLINVLGEPVDEKGPVKAKKTYPIHRPAPKLEDQETKTEVLETGIKVVDLLEPYSKGGKVGLFGGAGVGKTVIIMSSSITLPCTTADSRCSRVWASGRARAMTCGTRCRSRRSSIRMISPSRKPRWSMAR